MGWFWADTTAPVRQAVHQPAPPHGQATSENGPPPGCPIYKPSATNTVQIVRPSSERGGCPVAHIPDSSTYPSQQARPYASPVNPLNNMPSLSQDRTATQKTKLPITRERSTIPRADVHGTWEYPSPQQMYNAMLRKGHDDTPEDAVESMVSVHNFLNEGAWHEIEGWEKRFGRGLIKGFNRVKFGEEEAEFLIAEEARSGPPWAMGEHPKLVRFMGRPGDMSPKARMWEVMGKIWPSKFAGALPFDRHDWFVERTWPDGKKVEVRYVIDYYEGPDEPTGEPVFYLDVRPAVDGPSAACQRMMRWGGDVWCRASGAKARQEDQ